MNGGVSVDPGQAPVIKHALTAAGAGLLEAALQREGAKGCTSILCTKPVEPEPPYVRFDADHILQGTLPAQKERPLAALDTTLDVYAAPDDLLTIPFMETLLRALAVFDGPFAFELVGNQDGVTIRFGLPREERPGVEAAIVGVFPPVRLVENARPFPRARPSMVEELLPVAPYWRQLSLLHDGASPLSIAATAISALTAEELGLFQVLLRPTAPEHDWHYNTENLAEAELRATRLAQLGGLSSRFSYDEQLPPLRDERVQEKVRRDVATYATITRYAAWSTSTTRTNAFLQGMRAATGMLRFGNRAWRHLPHDALVGALGPERVAKMVVERRTHRPGLLLTSWEVASIVHLPRERDAQLFNVMRLRRGLEWTGPTEEADGSAVLGTNTYAGASRPVILAPEQRLRHVYVSGTTGTGKSTFLLGQILADAEQGLGVCVIDPHGDLVLDVLGRLPSSRMNDLVYVSFAEQGLVPRWNPFTVPAPSGTVADDIAHAFLATTSGGARMEHNFRLLAFTVHVLGGTLQDLAELASRTPRGDALRLQALERVRNQEAQRFLRDELPNYGKAELASVTNKLSRLLLVEPLAATFQQAENALEPRAWMDEGKVVLIHLAASSIGADHARFVGGLLVSLIHRAALTRANVREARRRPFFFYLDECQRFQTATLEEVLAEGRKYGLALVLAHQESGQLSTALRRALGNCETRIVFRPVAEDLRHARRALLEQVAEHDLHALGIGEAYVASGGLVASLATHRCAYPEVRDARQAARAYAEQHYVRVETIVHPTPVRRPRVHDTFGEDP